LSNNEFSFPPAFVESPLGKPIPPDAPATPVAS
jgi:hypothetical protein